MTKRRWWMLGAVVLFVGLAILQVSSGIGGSELKLVQTLPDGHTLILNRVAVGSRMEFGSRYAELLGKILPQWLKKKLHVKAPEWLHIGDPALAVWLEYDGPEKGISPSVEYRIANEAGYYGSKSSLTRKRTLGGTNRTEIGIVFKTFPRSSRVVRLGVFLPDKSWDWKRVAEFVIDNPDHASSYPVWPSEKLPVTRNINGLEITLTRLAYGAGSSRKFEAGNNEREARALASFVVRTNGVITKDWKPDGVLLTDATGNETTQGSWGSTWRGKTNYFQWSPSLWPETGGHRFRFEFTRVDTASFASNELIVIKGLKVPAETNVTELNLLTNMFGHTVRIVGLAGRKGRYSNYSRTSSGQMGLDVEVKPPLMDKQIDLISAVDEKGRKVKTSGASWSRQSGTYSFSIEPHNQAKEVDITLAVHESVYVDFVVVPEMLVPEDSPK